MTLPAAAWSGPAFLGRPSVIHNASRRQGNTTRTRKLLLDQITYTTGGLVLTFPDTQLDKVFDLTVRCGLDPNGAQIAPPPCSFQLLFAGDGSAKLKIFQSNAEVANNWTGPASTYAWLTFTGVC